MLRELRRRVCEANLELVRAGLVIQTFGNVSGVDRERGVMVIKPSGVSYAGMKPAQMVEVSLATGEPKTGGLRPSSDTATHLELYRAWTEVGGVVHTHSLHATAWAQARREIPALGTTHADYFGGAVPCTRPLKPAEIRDAYEANTGKVILECFNGFKTAHSGHEAGKNPPGATSAVTKRRFKGTFRMASPLERPGVLVASHGPFAWGASVEEAVRHAEILEFLARLASETLTVNPGVGRMPSELLRKHFSRKHGPAAYYGQH